MRDAICRFIERATRFKACCEAGDGAAAIEKAKNCAPALVVLNLGMPGMNGVDVASVLRDMLPATKIVGFTTFGEEFCRSILEETTSFDRILSKHQGLAKLAEAINTLLSNVQPSTRA